MGASFSLPNSNKYVIWARGKETNEYEEAMKLKHCDEEEAKNHEETLHIALGTFRREVNMFALGRKYVDAQVLYLYDGSSRLARAEMKEDNTVLELVFQNPKILRRWKDSPEILAPKQWPLAQTGFDAQFDRAEDAADGVTLRHKRD